MTSIASGPNAAESSGIVGSIDRRSNNRLGRCRILSWVSGGNIQTSSSQSEKRVQIQNRPLPRKPVSTLRD
jgi:hypothetical protein